ncbi:SET domain-containing protein [Peribacillus loiseleuriae]|uniref:SET domain-containing protein n=1 Tax=Peribacillus loiseleuriae TaxID=1679170 RepID=UPI003D0917EC
MGPIVMRNTGKYGRGIFANRNIKNDELIEEAPVIVIPKKEWKLMRDSVLLNYVFWWEEDKALALGYGSLYNHSYTPNAGYITNIKKQSIDFYARKDIHKGEEIMINYNGDPKDQSPLWFKVRE